MVDQKKKRMTVEEVMAVLKAGAGDPPTAHVEISGRYSYLVQDGEVAGSELPNKIIEGLRPLTKSVRLPSRHVETRTELCWVHPSCPMEGEKERLARERSVAEAAEAERMKDPRYALTKRLTNMDGSHFDWSKLTLEELQTISRLLDKA